MPFYVSQLGAYLVLFALVVALVLTAGRILREYERGVVFTLGRCSGVKGPGLILLIPIVQQMVRVDLRTLVRDVPSQDVISRDNVSVKVNAVIYFGVVDADKSVLQVEDFLTGTSQLAQTTLRSVLGKHELDEMLAERDRLNSDIQSILDAQTDAWGIKVSNVEIKHVDIDESMVRAIARQAEAERYRRARIIGAEAEQQAAEKLVEAGQILAGAPGSMQLRLLSTLQTTDRVVRADAKSRGRPKSSPQCYSWREMRANRRSSMVAESRSLATGLWKARFASSSAPLPPTSFRVVCPRSIKKFRMLRLRRADFPKHPILAESSQKGRNEQVSVGSRTPHFEG